MQQAGNSAGARSDALGILEHVMRGQCDRARALVSDTEDAAATLTEVVKLLALLLPSYPLDEMRRFVQTARKFDPSGP